MPGLSAALRVFQWRVRMALDWSIFDGYRQAHVRTRFQAARFASAGVDPSELELIPASFLFGALSRHVARHDRDATAFVLNAMRFNDQFRDRQFWAHDLIMLFNLEPEYREPFLFYASMCTSLPVAYSATFSGLPQSVAQHWVDASWRTGSSTSWSSPFGADALSDLITAWTAGPLRTALTKQSRTVDGQRCDYYDVTECAARLRAWLDVPEIVAELHGDTGPRDVVGRIITWANIATPWAWFAAGFTPAEAAHLVASSPDQQDVLALMSALRQPGSPAVGPGPRP